MLRWLAFYLEKLTKSVIKDSLVYHSGEVRTSSLRIMHIGLISESKFPKGLVGMENVKEPSHVNLWLQVTAVPLDSYCNDRSAEYEWRVLKEGGSLAAKQCLLNGAPELAVDWLNRRSQFFPEPAGGLWSIRPQNGWSFIRIPGESSSFLLAYVQSFDTGRAKEILHVVVSDIWNSEFLRYLFSLLPLVTVGKDA